MKFYFNQLSNNLFAARQTTKKNQTITSEDIYRDALLDDLRKTKMALENAYLGFDNVTEPDLIDCYIYELNSVITRYNYLLEEVGKLNRQESPASESTPVPLAAIPVLANQGDDVPLYSELTGTLALEVK
jgi:hypothetical protein